MLSYQIFFDYYLFFGYITTMPKRAMPMAAKKKVAGAKKHLQVALKTLSGRGLGLAGEGKKKRKHKKK